jgi:hypothetical protein
VISDLSEVSALSSRVLPYLTHYRQAFAFSNILYLHPHRLALRFAFPEGRNTGLPSSAQSPLYEGLDPIFLPEALHLRWRHGQPPYLASYLFFWFEPISPFGSFPLTTFTNGSHVLTIPSALGFQPHRDSQLLSRPHDRKAGFSRGSVVPDALYSAR